MEEKVRNILTQKFPGMNIDGELLENGIIDYTSITSLIKELSLETGVILPYEEITPENFSSVQSICRAYKKYID